MKTQRKKPKTKLQTKRQALENALKWEGKLRKRV